MTDTVNVPREWLVRFVAWVEEWKGPATDRTVDEMFRLYTDARRFALAAAPKAEPVSDHYKLDLTAVIRWLENGCDTAHAVSELKNYQARLSAQLLSNPQQLGLSDPHMVFVNMLRGGIAKPSPTDIGALYTGTDAVAVVDEVKRQNDTMFTQPDAPKVEQGPADCPACYRGEVFGLSMDNGFWVEIGWSAGGANPAGLNGEIQLIEHHPDGKVIERVYVAKDSPTFPAPASDELLEAIAKDASERVHKNGGCVPQLAYAPILFALQDGFAKHKGPQS